MSQQSNDKYLSVSAQRLLERFDAKSAHIGVVGMGYVGLPLAVVLAEAGYSVVGIDLDPQKIDMLHAGKSYIEDIPDHVLK